MPDPLDFNGDQALFDVAHREFNREVTSKWVISIWGTEWFAAFCLNIEEVLWYKRIGEEAVNMNHPIPEKVLNDGTKVPVIGFGTAGLKGADGVTAIASAIDAGYRLIDTAFNYENEGAVGKAVRQSSVLPKASSVKHQTENLNIFDFELSPEEINVISALSRADGRLWGQDPNSYEEL